MHYVYIQYQIHVSFHSSLYESIHPPIDPKIHQFIDRPKSGTISLSPSVSPTIHPSILPSIYSAIHPPFSVSIKLLSRLPINKFFTDRSFIRTVVLFKEHRFCKFFLTFSTGKTTTLFVNSPNFGQVAVILPEAVMESFVCSCESRDNILRYAKTDTTQTFNFLSRTFIF
jgi:hypothetical protein